MDWVKIDICDVKSAREKNGKICFVITIITITVRVKYITH